MVKKLLAFSVTANVLSDRQKYGHTRLRVSCFWPCDFYRSSVDIVIALILLRKQEFDITIYGITYKRIFHDINLVSNFSSIQTISFIKPLRMCQCCVLALLHQELENGIKRAIGLVDGLYIYFKSTYLAI